MKLNWIELVVDIFEALLFDWNVGVVMLVGVFWEFEIVVGK